MQHSWWFPVGELTRHIAVYSASFSLLVLAALYGSLVKSLAEHAVSSKFIVHVIVTLEYAMVVCDAITILEMMVNDVRRRLRRLM